MNGLETFNYQLYNRINEPITVLKTTETLKVLSPAEMKELNSKMIEMRLLKIRMETIFEDAERRNKRGF